MDGTGAKMTYCFIQKYKIHIIKNNNLNILFSNFFKDILGDEYNENDVKVDFNFRNNNKIIF